MKTKTWSTILICGWALMVPSNKQLQQYDERPSARLAVTWGHYGSFDTALACMTSATAIWDKKTPGPAKDTWLVATCLPMDAIYTHAKETKP